jgi:ribonucleoside-diphosphate reductase alpha chain
VTDRERLANRRNADIIDFEHGGRTWTATVGRFADGRVAEVFLGASKESAIAAMAAESAIVASLALQHGCPYETIRHALNGRDVGPLSAALDLIDRGGQ